MVELMIEISNEIDVKLDKMAKILNLSKTATIQKIISENYWATKEQIIEDVTSSSKFVEWSKVNLKDGQTFYGDIVNFVNEGDMSKIILQNEFQELEYEIYINLISRIDHVKGLDKNEFFLQPKKFVKDD